MGWTHPGQVSWFYEFYTSRFEGKSREEIARIIDFDQTVPDFESPPPQTFEDWQRTRERFLEALRATGLDADDSGDDFYRFYGRLAKSIRWVGQSRSFWTELPFARHDPEMAKRLCLEQGAYARAERLFKLSKAEKRDQLRHEKEVAGDSFSPHVFSIAKELGDRTTMEEFLQRAIQSSDPLQAVELAESMGRALTKRETRKLGKRLFDAFREENDGPHQVMLKKDLQFFGEHPELGYQRKVLNHYLGLLEAESSEWRAISARARNLLYVADQMNYQLSRAKLGLIWQRLDAAKDDGGPPDFSFKLYFLNLLMEKRRLKRLEKRERELREESVRYWIRRGSLHHAQEAAEGFWGLTSRDLLECIFNSSFGSSQTDFACLLNTYCAESEL